MEVQVLDTLGLQCPRPIMKLAIKATELNEGEVLEILGDCATFEKDVRTWCERLGKVLLGIKDEGHGKQRIQIQF